MYCSFLWKWHSHHEQLFSALFFFHLGCALGLYLLHAIQMLFRRQDWEYSCWEFGNILSVLFAVVVSTSFLFSVPSVVWGRYQVLVEGSLLDAEEQIKIWNLGAAAPQGSIGIYGF